MSGCVFPRTCCRCGRGGDGEREPAHDAGDQACEREGERCVFCHTADGMQYVPMHFDDHGSMLPYTEALGAHCACASCWAAWENRHSQGRPWVGRAARVRRAGEAPCPVCQRRLNVCRGYPEGGLCTACLDEVVLKTVLPVPQRERSQGLNCCGCTCHFPCVLCVVLLFMIILPAAARCAVQIALTQTLEQLDNASEGQLESTLPPALRQTLCPVLDELAGMIDLASGLFDPLLSTAWEVGIKICGTGNQRRALPRRQRQDAAFNERKQEL